MLSAKWLPLNNSSIGCPTRSTSNALPTKTMVSQKPIGRTKTLKLWTNQSTRRTMERERKTKRRETRLDLHAPKTTKARKKASKMRLKEKVTMMIQMKKTRMGRVTNTIKKEA